MASKPGKLKKALQRVMKRGPHGSTEANTLADVSLGFTCLTGLAAATEWVDPPDESILEEDERESQPVGFGDLFPPLTECAHAPVFDMVFANIHVQEGTQPAPAHLLFVCLDEDNEDEVQLCLRIPFTDEKPAAEIASEGSEKDDFAINRQVFNIPFPTDQKDPDGRRYLALLFVYGDSARAADISFEGIEVFDLSDDSEHGFANAVVAYLDSNDQAQIVLPTVETSIEMDVSDELIDDLEDDELLDDPAQKQDNIDDWPWKQAEGESWLSE